MFKLYMQFVQKRSFVLCCKNGLKCKKMIVANFGHQLCLKYLSNFKYNYAIRTVKTF